MLGGDGGTRSEEGAGEKLVMIPSMVAQEAAASAHKHAQSPMELQVVGSVQMCGVVRKHTEGLAKSPLRAAPRQCPQDS